MSASNKIAEPAADTITRPDQDDLRRVMPQHRPDAVAKRAAAATVMTQAEARARRMNGYGFSLTTDFDLANEVEAIVGPISPRVTHVLTGRFSDATKERVEDYVRDLTRAVEVGVTGTAKLFGLAVPPHLPVFDATYLDVGEHTLVSLVTAHAGLVAPALAAKLRRHSQDEIEAAGWVAPGSAPSGADRLLAALLPVVRQMVVTVDRNIRVTRVYLAKLEKLAAPTGRR